MLSFDDAEECQTLTCETKAERALGTSQQCDDRMHPKSFRRQWPRRRVGRTAFLKTAKSRIESQDKSEGRSNADAEPDVSTESNYST